jgi:hypothetical protein
MNGAWYLMRAFVLACAQMKKKAFDTIDHIAANCDLHKVVTDRAKELFATWRNVKEHVQQRNAVICACVVAAYRTVAVDELQAQEARRKEALARAVTRCIQCGNRDETLFLSDEEDASKKVCGRVPNDEGGEKCGGRVELVIPDITASDTLYPFSCAKCDAKFNTQKALDVHRGACPKQVRDLALVGSTVTLCENFLSAAVTSRLRWAILYRGGRGAAGRERSF